MEKRKKKEKGYIVVLVTVPDEGVGSRIAKILVENKLAGCVNITTVRSIYSWQGKIEDHPESLLIIKSKKSVFQKLKKTVEENHPYTTPEIIEIEIKDIAEKYGNWLDEVVSK